MGFLGKKEPVENKGQEDNEQLVENGARLESASKELLKLTTALSTFDVNMHFISTRSKYAAKQMGGIGRFQPGNRRRNNGFYESGIGDY